MNTLPAIYFCVVTALAGGTLRLSSSDLQTSALLRTWGLGRFLQSPSDGLSSLFLVNSFARNVAGEQLELDKRNVISADAFKCVEELCFSGGLYSGCCDFFFFSASHRLCRFLFEL